MKEKGVDAAWRSTVHRTMRLAVLLAALPAITLFSDRAGATDRFMRCAREFGKPEQREQRLRCYDREAGLSAESDSPSPPAAGSGTPRDPATSVESGPKPDYASLWGAWSLDNETGLALTAVQPYRPMYIVARKSTNINFSPASPNHPASAPQDFDAAELKFQLSFKNELVSPAKFKALFGSSNFRLWFAYTQQSNWQAFNARHSSPFRENNFEPEVILTYKNSDNARSDGRPKLVNLGLVHQSNGQDAPGSRSWNRAYLQGGWQVRNDTSLLARAWWRLPEKPTIDDNPDIRAYVGRADLVLRGEALDHRYSLLMRHNLQLGHSRGFMQFDWDLTKFFTLPIHFQMTSGYGESLIDYNHRQTSVGLGVAFGNW